MSRYNLNSLKEAVNKGFFFSSSVAASRFKGSASDMSEAIASLAGSKFRGPLLLALSANKNFSVLRRKEAIKALREYLQDKSAIRVASEALVSFANNRDPKKPNYFSMARPEIVNLAASKDGDFFLLPDQMNLATQFPFGNLESVAAHVFIAEIFEAHPDMEIVRDFVKAHGKLGQQFAAWSPSVVEFCSDTISDESLNDPVVRAGLSVRWRKLPEQRQSKLFEVNYMHESDDMSWYMPAAPVWKSIKDGSSMTGSLAINFQLASVSMAYKYEEQMEIVSRMAIIDSLQKPADYSLTRLFAVQSRHAGVAAHASGKLLDRDLPCVGFSKAQEITGRLAKVCDPHAISFISWCDSIGIPGARSVEGCSRELSAKHYSNSITFDSHDSFCKQIDGVEKFGLKILSNYGSKLSAGDMVFLLECDEKYRIKKGQAILLKAMSDIRDKSADSGVLFGISNALKYMLAVTNPFLAAAVIGAEIASPIYLAQALDEIRDPRLLRKARILAKIVMLENQLQWREKEGKGKVVRGDYGFRTSGNLSRSMYREEVRNLQFLSSEKMRLNNLVADVDIESELSQFVRDGGDIALLPFRSVGQGCSDVQRYSEPRKSA